MRLSRPDFPPVLSAPCRASNQTPRHRRPVDRPVEMKDTVKHLTLRNQVEEKRRMTNLHLD